MGTYHFCTIDIRSTFVPPTSSVFMYYNDNTGDDHKENSSEYGNDIVILLRYHFRILRYFPWYHPRAMQNGDRISAKKGDAALGPPSEIENRKTQKRTVHTVE